MKEALKFVTWPAIAGLLAALLILERGVAPGAPNGQDKSYARAVATASPSVVNIYIEKLVAPSPNALLQDRFLNRYNRRVAPRREETLGSGVIMDADGHILTNNHVISGADKIHVQLQDGRRAQAQVIGADPATDLAVLRLDLPDLQPIQPGAYSDIRVGDVVLAIGNPLGLGHSVTQGIVSALGRYTRQGAAYENFIQTDASIHQGNSGGALIDTRGRLLGINTLIFTNNQGRNSNQAGIGISLAIPVDLASFVMRDLIDFGEVIRGWLGLAVNASRVADADGSREVLWVTGVEEDGPAFKAGIEEGDIITHIDGEAVVDSHRTMHRIAMLRPGDAVDISLQRERQSLQVNAIVGTRQQSQLIR